jgi:hypothetical protein
LRPDSPEVVDFSEVKQADKMGSSFLSHYIDTSGVGIEKVRNALIKPFGIGD